MEHNDCGNPLCKVCHPDRIVADKGTYRFPKPDNVGGTSDAWDIPHIVEFVKILNPKSVLDVGVGCFGKNGYILRQYVEHKFRKYYGSMYLKIDGIESYKDNFDYVSKLGIYDGLHLGEALARLAYLLDQQDPFYDVVICTHVLEHHTEKEAWQLLDWMYSLCHRGLIIACPNGEYKFEGNINPYQDHKSTWSPDKIATKYPITSAQMGWNNTGHSEFLIVIPK